MYERGSPINRKRTDHRVLVVEQGVVLLQLPLDAGEVTGTC